MGLAEFIGAADAMLCLRYRLAASFAYQATHSWQRLKTLPLRLSVHFDCFTYQRPKLH
jgi:hypothetical protein